MEKIENTWNNWWKWIIENNQSNILEILNSNYFIQWIDFIFSQNEKLRQIWTKEDYFSYLHTIFPDSKIRGIAWHGTDTKFDDFNESFLQKKDPWYYWKWFYFWIWKDAKVWAENIAFTYTNDKEISKYIKPVILYAKDPIEINSLDFSNTWKELPEWYDSVIVKDHIDEDFPQETWQVLVKTAKQIHTLWSKKDISLFENYMNKNITMKCI